MKEQDNSSYIIASAISQLPSYVHLQIDFPANFAITGLFLLSWPVGQHKLISREQTRSSFSSKIVDYTSD